MVAEISNPSHGVGMELGSVYYYFILACNRISICNQG